MYHAKRCDIIYIYVCMYLLFIFVDFLRSGTKHLFLICNIFFTPIFCKFIYHVKAELGLCFTYIKPNSFWKERYVIKEIFFLVLFIRKIDLDSSLACFVARHACFIIALLLYHVIAFSMHVLYCKNLAEEFFFKIW